MATQKTQSKDIRMIIGLMKQYPDDYSQKYLNSTERGSMRNILNYAAKAEPSEAGSFIAKLEDQVIGHIAYMRDVRNFEGRIFEMIGLVIGKRFSHLGLGTALVLDLLHHLERNQMAQSVWAQTENKSNIAFYESFEFKHIATFPNYWGLGRDRYIVAKYF